MNIGLSHLRGNIDTFFKKIGLTKLKYKPAFNPYTEPSLEIFGYHLTLKRWVEIGNSGVFRPEMLEPMGLPKNVTTIAWGLSLERPIMIYYDVKISLAAKFRFSRRKTTQSVTFSLTRSQQQSHENTL